MSQWQKTVMMTSLYVAATPGLVLTQYAWLTRDNLCIENNNSVVWETKTQKINCEIDRTIYAERLPDAEIACADIIIMELFLLMGMATYIAFCSNRF